MHLSMADPSRVAELCRSRDDVEVSRLAPHHEAAGTGK